MKLNMRDYQVHSVNWGDKSGYSGGCLTVCKKELFTYLEGMKELEDFYIERLDLANPDTPTRIINVMEVLPAYARLEEGAVDYPGVLGKVQIVGNGISARLTNFSVLGVSPYPNRSKNRVVDKSGSGAEMSPFGKHCNLVFKLVKKDVSIPESDYQIAVKKIGLRLGVALARIAAASLAIPEEKEYCLNPVGSELPKVVYLCMCTNHQKIDQGEPILYGNDCYGLLPTLIHPNEVLDGAVLAPNFSVALDTYSVINNEIVESLYKRHGKDLNFLGVIFYVSYTSYQDKARTDLMASSLAADLLHADGAIITKCGGGVGETDIVNIATLLEQRGIPTNITLFCQEGAGPHCESVAELTMYTPELTAIVSTGILSQPMKLTLSDDTVSPEGITVLGGRDDSVPVMVENVAVADHVPPQPAAKLREIRAASIAGGISQTGLSRLGPVKQPDGSEKTVVNALTAGERGVRMLLSKINHQPYQSEIPIDLTEKVIPASGAHGKLKIAMFTDGGLVLKGNPDDVPNGSNTEWYRIKIEGRDSFTPDFVEANHWGYTLKFVNEDPNRLLPLDALRELEKEGGIELYPIVFSVSGAGILNTTGVKLGAELAEEMKKAGVNAAIASSTASHSAQIGALCVREFEKIGIPVAHFCSLVDIAKASGTNRLIIGTNLLYPTGMVGVNKKKELAVRRKLVRKAIEAIRDNIRTTTVYEP
jgi:sarcosine reductase